MQVGLLVVRQSSKVVCCRLDLGFVSASATVRIRAPKHRGLNERRGRVRADDMNTEASDAVGVRVRAEREAESLRERLAGRRVTSGGSISLAGGSGEHRWPV